VNDAAVVVEAVRTPTGKSGGRLAAIHPVDLSAHVLRSLIQRAGIRPDLVDEVVWGCFSQRGAQGFNIGRNAVLAAGWPDSVPAFTIDRQCGSSQQSIQAAAAGLVAGQYGLAVAGGVESMSRVPMFPPEPDDPYGDQYAARYAGVLPDQGEAAERLTAERRFPRSALDAYALRSHTRAVAAQDDRLFADEIVTVPTPAGTVDTDQGVRRGSTVEKLAALPPIVRPDGVITAGHAASVADGAAALLLATPARARALGLAPIARIRATAVAAADPIRMFTAPVPATAAVLRRAGIGLTDVGAVEVNEAFAPVVLSWLKDTGTDDALVNPLGGAIALGHPLGASGARLAVTLLHHMRRCGIRYGLQVMCQGGGQANATVYELL